MIDSEHEQLLHFLYAVPIGFIQTSPDGEIELINSAAAKLLLPVAPSRKLTNLFTTLAEVAPDLRQQVMRVEELNCTVCEGLRYEIRPDVAEHSALHVSFSLMKIDGKRLIAVLTDITQLVQDERALQQSRAHYQDQLLRSHERLEGMVADRTSQLRQSQVELERRALQAEAASKAKGDFLANMSHEIRTPLNAILGNAELMRREGLSIGQLDRLNKLETSARYLLATLTDVLELSKVEAGERPIVDVDFVLDDVLSQARAVVEDAAAAKKLTLQLDRTGVPQALRGDSAKLSQIIVNYLNNAIKFTDNGRISLDVKLVSDAAESCELRFEVHDTGVGISAAMSTQLFTAFERGANDAWVRGAGLGLAINARLAKLMNGRVGATGELGKGSMFWFGARFGKALPASARDTKLSAEELLLRDHRGASVLLVEDEPMNQTLALEFLRDIGLAPMLARDGVEAIRMVEAEEFGLVLMDLQMPRLNGLQATTAIRALPGRQALPIVAMTANAFREDRERCLAAGMNDFLEKPFDVDELCETLLRWLERPAN